MQLHLTELQQITLRDILVTAGITPRQAEDVFLILSLKRERPQLAFYYKACGLTQEQIAERLGVDQAAIARYFSGPLSDLRDMLMIGTVIKK